MSFRRIRAVPWILLLEAAMLARDRWSRLSPQERAQLSAMVRKSRGKPANLTAKDRADLKELAGKLDVVGAARDLSPMRRRRRRR